MTAPEPTAKATPPVQYAVDSGWLVEVVNHHTCGTGPGGHYGAHEPGCGLEPVAKVVDLLAAEAERDALLAEVEAGRRLRARVEGLLAEWRFLPVWGPDERGLFILDGVDVEGLRDDLRALLADTEESPMPEPTTSEASA